MYSSERLFGPGKRKFEQANLQKFTCLGAARRILEVRIDRRVIWLYTYALTFESVDEIPGFDKSNEIYWIILICRAVVMSHKVTETFNFTLDEILKFSNFLFVVLSGFFFFFLHY